jgi:inorganic triphosphatase YgiF
MEFETTLLIASYRADIVMEKLSAMNTIGPFEILPKRSLFIHDSYFDTSDRSLMKKGIALRNRNIGQTNLLCMKGSEHINEWGGIRRLEIEEEWSEKVLEKILQTQDHISFDTDNTVFDEADPIKTLECLGLYSIQDRQTTRIVRDIIDPGGKSQGLCAEMALDRVLYRFGNSKFNHFEVEIEAKIREGEEHIKTIVTLLKTKFPGELKRWDHNKLITGYAIEELLQKGDLAAYSQHNNMIDQTGYEKIASFIKQLRPCSDP